MRVFVAMELRDSPVQVVMPMASPITNRAPPRPALPTTHPMRTYMMTPRMVSRVGVKTPVKVPN